MDLPVVYYPGAITFLFKINNYFLLEQYSFSIRSKIHASHDKVKVG